MHETGGGLVQVIAGREVAISRMGYEETPWVGFEYGVGTR
jgi:hypothetical protein